MRPMILRVLAVISALVAPTVIGVTGSTASAVAPDPSCNSPKTQYNVSGDENRANGDSQFLLRGMRGDAYVGSSLYCNRVSSFAIFSSYTTDSDYVYVEFGWVLGYSGCNGHYYSTPRLFKYWSNVGDGNTDHCLVLSGAGQADAFHSMRIADVNGDTTWNAYYDGSVVANSEINTNFTAGKAVASAERSTSQDSSFAEWLNLDKYTDGNFTSFENLRRNFQNDPGFHFVRVSADHGQVLAN